MTTRECYSTEVKLRNTAGREFVVKYFVNPEGYWWRGERMMCMTRKTTPATQRLAVYNHLFEPTGSEYYCAACVPPALTPTSE